MSRITENAMEQRLVALAKMGDPTAFEELFMLNKEKIFNLTYRYTGSRQDAEDLLQETFSRAFLSIKKFKALGDAAFSTWLYRIGINCSINFLKKHKNRRHRQVEGEIHTAAMAMVSCDKANPEEAAVISEMEQQLEAGLEQLSPKQRMIFLLKHQQGLKAREIAAHMNCSEGSIKKQLARAMEKLVNLFAAVPALVGDRQ